MEKNEKTKKFEVVSIRAFKKSDGSLSEQPTTIEAFKTSDGSLFEDESEARKHEAYNVLQDDLNRGPFCSDHSTGVILNNIDKIFEALKKYKKAVNCDKNTKSHSIIDAGFYDPLCIRCSEPITNQDETDVLCRVCYERERR